MLMLPLAYLLGQVGEPEIPRHLLSPVADTFLDRSAPDTNFGREPAVVVGPGKVGLFRFPHLDYAYPAGSRVKSARLVLRMSRGTVPTDLIISRMLQPWAEGSGRTMRFDRIDPANPPMGESTWKDGLTGRQGLRWASAGASAEQDARRINGFVVREDGDFLIVDGLAQAVQAMIDNPTRNFGFRLESQQEFAVLSGEWSAERPRLEVEVEQGEADGADLALLVVEPTQPTSTPGWERSWRAVVKNIGTVTTSETRLSVTAGKLGAISVPVPALEPGQTRLIPFNVAINPLETIPGQPDIRAELELTGDNTPSNNALEARVGGLGVSFEADDAGLTKLRQLAPKGEVLGLYQMILRRLNGQLLPFSRYGFAPHGAQERLRMVLDPASADVRVDLSNLDAGNPMMDALIRTSRAMSPFSAGMAKPPSDAAPFDPEVPFHYGWLPDTRDDGLRVPALELPPHDTTRPVGDPIPLWENGLLSRTEVGYLQANLGKRGAARETPWSKLGAGLMVRAATLGGRPLSNADIEVFAWSPSGLGPALAKDNTRSGGIAVLSPEKREPLLKNVQRDGSGSWLLVRATRGGASATAWVAAWQLADWMYRGNSGMPSVEVRFSLPSDPLDLKEDLARDKLVVDSAGRFPAELIALVDGDPATTLDLFPEQWLEIDLGRDRLFGGIEFDVLASAPLAQYEMSFYKTSQRPEIAQVWFREADGARFFRKYGVKNGNRLTGTVFAETVQGRYIRIVNRGAQKATLTGLRILPIARAQP
ncbi:MAG: hypothetical protein LCH41_01665 [Armatimonadetes bacterium]|nr:hypothetical protein [Armatimonadota bacterium]